MAKLGIGFVKEKFFLYLEMFTYGETFVGIDLITSIMYSIFSDF